MSDEETTHGKVNPRPQISRKAILEAQERKRRQKPSLTCYFNASREYSGNMHYSTTPTIAKKQRSPTTGTGQTLIPPSSVSASLQT